MILLDTHAALWLRAGDARLGSAAIAEIQRAWETDFVASAISFWKMAMLRVKGRIGFSNDVCQWRQEQLNQGLIEIPVDGGMTIRANRLEGFHPDPADRITIATALNDHVLATADREILEWPGDLHCLDAAQ